MSGLKISELTQPSLSADRNILVGDLFPIAGTRTSALSTFALPGAALITNLASVGTGISFVGSKTFNVNAGNSYNIKSLSAIAPIRIVDDGNTVSLSLSGTITDAIAGLVPTKVTLYGTGAASYFYLPNVSLPVDPASYRIDINGVLQEPNVDYSIITTGSPYQVRFSTPPSNGEKIVVVAFSPSVSDAYASPIVEAFSILGNTTNVATNGTSIPLSANQVLANNGTLGGLTLSANQVLANNGTLKGLSLGTNEFVGNIGSGIQATNLSKWSTKTTSYSALTSDFSATIAMSSNSPLIFTIPNNNFSQGFQLTVIGLGTGTVTFSPSAGSPGIASGTGVILNQAYGLTQLASRWSAATIIYSGTPSTGWTIFGDLG